MNVKRMIFISLMLTILTMAAVSAADGNVTSQELAVSEDSIIDSSFIESDEVLGTGEGTFSDLSALIGNTSENGILELDKDYQNRGNESEITISKAMTIDGKGHILNANNNSRIFKVDSSEVILKNIVFKYGKNIDDDNYGEYMSVFNGVGGAVMWFRGANGGITNCSFINCSSSYGGAIFWFMGVNGSVDNCSFQNCNAVSFYSDGGAIGWSADNGVISNCRFINCNAPNVYASGGAINFAEFEYDDGENQSVCSSDNSLVYNCIFIDCSAGSGGAIYWNQYEEQGYDVNVSNCLFRNCSSQKFNGGALSCDFGSNYHISNCSFLNCSSNINGGAIFTLSETFNTYDCSFINCSASNNGGAISFEYSKYDHWLNPDFAGCDQCIVNYCSFQNCHAVNGSAISWNGYNGTINNTSFDYSTASLNGGAVYWGRTNGKIESSNFTNSKAKNGAGIYVTENNTVTISNSKFENNAADELGGAIYYNKLSSNIDCTFSGNTDPEIYFVPEESEISPKTFTDLASLINSASQGDVLELTDDYSNDGSVSGDGIDISKSLTIDGKGHILDAKNKSGVLHITAENVTIKNIVFKNGNNHYGGAIYYEDGNNVVFSNCSFIQCSGYEGGAINWAQNNGVISNCRFVNCSAERGGGVYFWFDAYGSVSDCTFENCSADDGGAIYYLGINGTVLNCSFTNCLAHESGGAINWNGNEGIISGCIFVNCSAVTGGSIYCDVECRIDNSVFINSNAENGKAIYACENTIISNSRFESDNSQGMDGAVRGGTISDCTFGNDNVSVKAAPEISVIALDTVYGQNAVVNVVLPSNATGEIILRLFKRDDEINNSTSGLSKGAASKEFSGLGFGIYRVNVEYLGDSNYYGTSANATFAVRPEVSISQNVNLGDDANIAVDLIDAEGTLLIKIDGVPSSIQTISNGKVDYTFSTANMTARNHTITFEYYGDSFDKDVFNYMDGQPSSPMEYNVYVTPKDVDIPEEVETDDGILILVFDENATGTVKVFVDGISYKVFEVVNGIARIDLSEYKDGDHYFAFEYSGDEIYEGFMKSVIVHHKVAKITAGNFNALYSAAQKYSVKVYDKEGALAENTLVVFKIKGKQVGKSYTNAQGVATYKVTNVPGTYKLTVTSLGVSKTTTLTVKHLVTLKSVTVKKSAKKLVLQATLAKVNKKYLKNKKITFKFNGKKYAAKTNKKGVAKVTIKSKVLKKLKVGKKVTYQATYLKDTVKKTVKIKK